VDDVRRGIRPYEVRDEVQVVRVWHDAGRSAYTFLPTWRSLSLAEAHTVFRERIVPHCEIWVAAQAETIIGYLALRGSYIDRLYVDPSAQGKGWGSALIRHAKRLYPEGLELHTHQENYRACWFYERNGFLAVKYGVSPPPECAPDVEFHWRPAQGN
jgi:ribosomal protein S18 acetylase RimI-like enzyme